MMDMFGAENCAFVAVGRNERTVVLLSIERVLPPQ